MRCSVIFVMYDSTLSHDSVHVLLNEAADTMFATCLLQLATEANTVSLVPRWQVRGFHHQLIGYAPLTALHHPINLFGMSFSCTNGIHARRTGTCELMAISFFRN